MISLLRLLLLLLRLLRTLRVPQRLLHAYCSCRHAYSCGYGYEHTLREVLDLTHLTTLAKRLIRADWTQLFAPQTAARSA